MKFEKQVVISLIREMKWRDLLRRSFGALGHHYKLNPPLSVEVLREFEVKHSLVLPADYRYFLTEIANGGAGPFYGVFPFGQQEDGQEWKGGHLVGDLKKPFVHEQAWNEGGQKSWRASVMNGAIPICAKGCGLRIWLVINGPQAGYVWGDDRADFKGIYPLQGENGKQLSFSDWYLSWAFDGLGRRSPDGTLPLIKFPH